jgi:hypothetical protein
MRGAAAAEKAAARGAGGEMMPPMMGGAGAGGGKDSEHRNRYVKDTLFEQPEGTPPVLNDPDYQPGGHQPSEDEGAD